MTNRLQSLLFIVIAGCAGGVESADTRVADIREFPGWYANDRGDTVMVVQATPVSLRFIGLGRLSGMMVPVNRGMVRLESFDQVKDRIDLNGSVIRQTVDGSVRALSFGEDPEEHHMLLERVPGSTIVRREIDFSNGDVRLHGLFFAPESGARSPAVVFIHGTGEQLADRTYELAIARAFLRRGISVLTFDKRGCGKSTGDWRTAGLRDLATDVAAAIAFLKARPEIDPARIGVYGVSEGGWIAPVVNELVPDLAFIVNHGGPGVEPLEDEADDLTAGIAKLKLQSADSALAMRVANAWLDVYRGPGAFPQYLAAIAAVRDKPWFKPFEQRFPKTEDNWEIIWWRARIADSPMKAWRRRSAPTLVVIGEKDATMNVKKSLAAFESLRSVGPRLDIRVLPRANHSLRIYGGVDEGLNWADGFPNLAADWVVSAVRDTN